MSVSDRMNREELLRRLVDGKRAAHAYVIAGPDGEAFADRLAAAMVCSGERRPCGQCPHCRKTALHIHPDIIRVSPAEGKKEIVVDQVRDLRADAYICPNEAQRKVYLIQPASALNPSAQNALLKVLEEGPAYAVFLLVTEQPGVLLPTVRSRCEEIVLIGGEETGEQNAQAEELAQLLLTGTEQAVLARCVEMEKLSREEMSLLLEDTIGTLEGRMKEDLSAGPRILPLIETLQTLWNAAQFNTGVGHLAGWLCAAVFR